MEEDTFCLKWSEYNSSISQSFEEFRDVSEFCDLTFISDDKQQFKAHKVILAASSAFFRNILSNMNHPYQQAHSMLFLNGIHSAELKALLEFIYQGEVKMGKQNLQSFVGLAQKLELKGTFLLEEENSSSNKNIADTSVSDASVIEENNSSLSLDDSSDFEVQDNSSDMDIKHNFPTISQHSRTNSQKFNSDIDVKDNFTTSTDTDHVQYLVNDFELIQSIPLVPTLQKSIPLEPTIQKSTGGGFLHNETIEQYIEYNIEYNSLCPQGLETYR